MRDDGRRRTHMERSDMVLQGAVLGRDPLMLAKMLGPRIEPEGFDAVARIRRIELDRPFDGAVPAPDAFQLSQRDPELVEPGRGDPVFYDDFDRTLGAPFADQDRSRPVQ